MTADADPPPRRLSPRGSTVRKSRTELLQALDKYGLLTYVGLEPPPQLPGKPPAKFKIEANGQARVLQGREVEAYVTGALDTLRRLDRRLPEDLEQSVTKHLAYLRGE